jgi:predicted DNA-binding protein with PD1-like motif
MQIKVLQAEEPTTLAVIFDTGDEVMAGLLDAAQQHQLDAARFTAIGAFSTATLAFFDWESKQYQEIPVTEQTEVLSLLGDIALEDGAPKVHAHAVLGFPDGTTRGGHLMEARVRPTLEVIVDESPSYMRRRHDPESGLALIEFASDHVPAD